MKKKKAETMRLIHVNVYEQTIAFDNGIVLKASHRQECCEDNYADFDQIDDLAYEYDFDVFAFRIESVPNSGFTFGDNHHRCFVPCYSIQNGYYSSDIEITLYKHYTSPYAHYVVDCKETELTP